MPVLEVKNLTVRYGATVAVEGVSFRIEEPGLYALLGPNGAGKTTLMRAILGLVRPASGKVILNGDDVTGRPELVGRHASYVPQRPPISRFVPMTPWDLVCTAISLREDSWPRLRCRHPHRVEYALRLVGLPERVWRYRLAELSGGQLMRSFIARALIVGRELLLLDEPFAPIDPSGRVGLARLLWRLARDRIVIVSMHDYMLVRNLMRGAILLNRRLIAFGPPDRVLTIDYLRRAYGEAAIQLSDHIHIADYHGG